MRFYGREQEIAFLKETRNTAERVARFTVVTGRGRIGKTTLIREAYKDEPLANGCWWIEGGTGGDVWEVAGSVWRV